MSSTGIVQEKSDLSKNSLEEVAEPVVHVLESAPHATQSSLAPILADDDFRQG